MWYYVLSKTKHGKLFCKDKALLMKLTVDYEDSEDWKDIDMIVVVPKPGGPPCPTTAKQTSAKSLLQWIHYCKNSPKDCAGDSTNN